MTGPNIRLLAHAAAAGLAVSALLFLLFWSLTMIVRSVPADHYASRAGQAFESGTLPRTFPALRGDRFAEPKVNGNDCLILDMLIARPPAETASLPARSLHFYANLEGDDYCIRLGNTVEDRVETHPYHRYIHGYVTGIGLLLLGLDYFWSTLILYAVNLALAGFLIWSAFRRRAEQRGRAYLVLGIGALLATGMHSFGWSPSFTFADMALLSFLLFCCRRGSWLSGEEREFGKALLVLALFGATVAAFEFLTGHLPVALALIALAFAIERTANLPRLVAAMTAFSLAFMAMFAFKFLAVSMTDYAEIASEAAGRIGKWTSSDQWDVAPENAATLLRAGVTPELIKSNRLLAYAYDIAKMVYHSPHLVGSMVVGAILFLVLPASALLRGAIGLARRQLSWTAALLWTAPFLIIFGWHLIFLSHGIVHTSFMNRTLAWAGVIALTLLLTFPLIEKSGARQGVGSAADHLT